MVKTYKERFPNYYFGHSAFVTSLSLFISKNMVLKKYLACRTFRKYQPYSSENCLSIRTFTYKIDANNQLHNCVCSGALSIKKAVLL